VRLKSTRKYGSGGKRIFKRGREKVREKKSRRGVARRRKNDVKMRKEEEEKINKTAR